MINIFFSTTNIKYKVLTYTVYNDFPKVVVIKFFLGLARFFSKNKNFFLSTAFSISMGRGHSISPHKSCVPSQKFNMCDFVASTHAFLRMLGLIVIIGAHKSKGIEHHCASC